MKLKHFYVHTYIAKTMSSQVRHLWPNKLLENYCVSCETQRYQVAISVNKYAIYAYTHGPVTGSGPSVVTLLATTCEQLVAS